MQDSDPAAALFRHASLLAPLAKKVVQQGRGTTGRDSVAPLEDPYEYVKKEGAIGRGEKRLRMRDATVEDLCRVDGINRHLAEQIYNALR